MSSLKTLFAFILVVVLFGSLISLGLGGVGGSISSTVPIGDGQIVPLQPGTTLYLMDMALQEKVGYYIFQNPAFPGANLWVGAIKDSGVGFTLTGSGQQALRDAINCGGNIGNCNTVVKFVQWAVSNGWTAVGAASVPSRIKIAIQAAIAARVASSSLYEASFVTIPGTAIDTANPMRVLEEYSGWKESEWN